MSDPVGTNMNEDIDPYTDIKSRNKKSEEKAPKQEKEKAPRKLTKKKKEKNGYWK